MDRLNNVPFLKYTPVLSAGISRIMLVQGGIGSADDATCFHKPAVWIVVHVCRRDFFVCRSTGKFPLSFYVIVELAW